MVTAKIISNAPYVASVVTVIAGLTLKDWGVIIGIILTTITVVVNWVYKHRQDKRETVLFYQKVNEAVEQTDK
ncbi:HP1 family phage holin [Spartinivicinus poritis]|uniref:HP1 family phage holin n=1 Tax=Spartinivicinus poritis TaxID=2994640 RepID=A0ABT5UIC2_9GAMM|nr:HP1 family phage holin [Spartinivicinus sp. A2-2]MDE1464804.1 HP1 family phage holin [Spartinivicinus sp. A2-2]